MRATAPTATLTQLTRLGFVNAYLVREEDGYTLVDTMLKGSAKGIREAAGDVPILRIVLTHGHGDHVGSADELDAIPAYLAEADAKILAGEAPPVAGVPDLAQRRAHPLGVHGLGREDEDAHDG
jgi:glyoxylase-like metal-dependent hydrolase (beta-lactamase superfamily II)